MSAGAKTCTKCEQAKHQESRPSRVRLGVAVQQVAELVKLHYDEFDLDAPRLKPGPARKTQDVVDRLDVARCEHCRAAHDRGHACGVCGAIRPECGTDKGYQKHQYHGEVACEPCCRAHAADVNRRRRARNDEEPRWRKGRNGIWRADTERVSAS